MSTPKQKIWDTVTRNYYDGPDLIADNRTFKKYCTEHIVSKARGRRCHPTTTSNSLFRHGRLRGRATGRLPLAPIGKDYASFAHGDVSSQLWLTTYPFMAHVSNFSHNDAVLFHVHVSAEAITMPAAPGWVSSLFPSSGIDPPEASSWCIPITNLQIAPAFKDDEDNFDATPSFIAIDGPILRSSVDILYLDKTFWRQYFDTRNENIDIFIPGVYPSDLSQIQRVAVDVAVLRNKDEFAAVARAIRRHLPNVTSFSAVITKVTPRPLDGPKQQVALLERGIPDLFVSFDEKVRLGVHEDASLVPAQGIVSANLSRLSLLATSEGQLQTQYILLAYFDDAVRSLEGGSADVDLPDVDVPQRQQRTNVKRATEAQADPEARSGSKGLQIRPAQSSTASQNRNIPQQTGVIDTSAQSKINRSSKLNERLSSTKLRAPPQEGMAPGLSIARRQWKSTKPSARHGNDTGSANKPTTKTPNIRLDLLKNKPSPQALYPNLGFAEIPDLQALRKPLTKAQLARQRGVQKPRRQWFESDHLGGFTRIPTSGAGALCAWRALEASWNAAIPRIARATQLPEAALKGMVTEKTLHETFTQDRRLLSDFGVVADRDFTVDHAARVFNKLVKDRTGLEMEVGWVGPLQPPAFGGSDKDLAYVLLGVPNEAGKPATQAVTRLWIWNNNDPRAGHYDGIADIHRTTQAM